MALIRCGNGTANKAKYVSSNTAFGANHVITYEGDNITLTGFHSSDPNTEHVIIIIQNNTVIGDKHAAIIFTVDTANRTITGGSYSATMDRWSISSDDNFEIT